MIGCPISSRMTSLEKESCEMINWAWGHLAFFFGPGVNDHAWCLLCLPIYDNIFVQCAVVLWGKLVSVLNYLMLNLITGYLYS